jgi:alpha-ribazole phosphatase
MRLLLVSHAQTDWNVQSRFQGHTDIPLNDCGRSQAHRWQRQLAEEPLEAIVASDLLRASETAEILAKPHGLSVRTDPRLRELSFGDWEGLTYAEIQQQYPDELAAWQQNYSRFSAPSGESLRDLEGLLHLFVGDLERQTPMVTVLVVAHRGSLRSLLCVLLGLPVDRQWDFRLDIASLSEVMLVGGKGSLERLNVTLGER